VEDTFGALSLVLNGGGIEQLQTVVHELNHTFSGTTPSGNQQQIRALLTNIDTAAGSLAGGRTAVDNALTAINGLTGQLKQGAPAISSGIDAAAPAVTVLAGADSQLNQLLTSIQQLAATSTSVAQQSGTNAVNDLNALTPVVNQLTQLGEGIDSDLGNLATFEKDTPKIAPGDYLQVSVVANVILPNGPSEATPGSTGFGPTSAAASGAAAVGELLAGGLL
jgi:phospholipid/cholesterol/gamma-HCH transport system substrate-binding protein